MNLHDLIDDFLIAIRMFAVLCFMGVFGRIIADACFPETPTAKTIQNECRTFNEGPDMMFIECSDGRTYIGTLIED